jgi:hypothetical protein
MQKYLAAAAFLMVFAATNPFVDVPLNHCRAVGTF